MKKKEKYQPITGLMGEAKDYHIYVMKPWDRLAAALIAMAGFMVVSYVFFHSILIGAFGGIFAAAPAQNIYQDYKAKKCRKSLLMQFRDLLESLASSYSAGYNTTGAFLNLKEDMTAIYGNGADIVKEVNLIITGMNNNQKVEDLVSNFAERSGLDDVQSFANVFEVSNSKGGDNSRVISETRDIINDKIEIELEIDTMLQGNKNELNIMILTPLIIVPMLGGLGGDTTITENSLENILVKLVCIGIFAVAYWMGRKMVDIKI